MTTLRDDGYLETDDPVVVACFIGAESEEWIYLVGAEHVERDTGHNDPAFIDDDYPILIPATVVAEACVDSDGFSNNEAVTIGMRTESGGIMDLLKWIKKHTKAQHE